MLWKLLRGIKRRCSNLYLGLPKGVHQRIDHVRGAEIQHSRAHIVRGLSSIPPSAVRCSCGKHNFEGIEPKGLERKQIVFVFNHLASHHGSVILRVMQSAGRIAQIFPDTQVSVCATQSRDLLGLDKALIVLAKGCAIDGSRMKKLLRRDNILIADYVDGVHQENIDASVDGFLCSSHTEFEWISHRLLKNQQAALVPHVPNDAFFAQLERVSWTKFGVGYYGERANGLFVTELNHIGVLEVGAREIALKGGDLTPDWVSDVSSVPVQFIARPSMQVRGGRFKPFNKGFQSAQLGQIVIGARFDAENRYWLGDDYPFYVEDETFDSCLAAIQRCRSAWESGDLAQARAVMQKLRVLSCPVQNALDYRDALVGYLS